MTKINTPKGVAVANIDNARNHDGSLSEMLTLSYTKSGVTLTWHHDSFGRFCYTAKHGAKTLRNLHWTADDADRRINAEDDFSLRTGIALDVARFRVRHNQKYAND